MIGFCKKHKKLFWGIAIVAAIVLIGFLVNVIYNAVLTKRVQNCLDGKVVIRKSEVAITVFTFNENTISMEYWWFNDHSVDGDLNSRFPYKAEAKIGSNEVQLWFKENGQWWYAPELILNKDGSVEFIEGNWRFSTMEEISTLRDETLCDHVFAGEKVLKKATCSESGEKSMTCTKCGYAQTQLIDKLEHNYENKICTVCGQKKQLAKAYNIEANTWYTYNNVLHVQNCKLVNAISVRQGKAMSVLYYAVCQHCHAVDDVSEFAGPEVNYPVQKIHVCDDCGKETLVKFEIG